MKLIDADKMKMQLNNATALGNFKEPFPLKFVLEFVDCLQEAIISCPKCHGEGKYYTLTQYQYEHEEIKSHKCLICKGTGKITIDEYEDYQERCRWKK